MMGIFLMVIAVLGLLAADKVAEVLAATILLIFGMWVYGAFDQVLGVNS